MSGSATNGTGAYGKISGYPALEDARTKPVSRSITVLRKLVEAPRIIVNRSDKWRRSRIAKWRVGLGAWQAESTAVISEEGFTDRVSAATRAPVCRSGISCPTRLGLRDSSKIDRR